MLLFFSFFFFSSRRRHTRSLCDWSSDVCSSDLNGQATVLVRALDHHAAIKATWSQEGLIQAVWPVSSSDDLHSLARIKAIHLDQQLVQSLLALVVAIDAGAALATNSINFVDKDDAGSSFLGLIKQVAHAARTHADQYFDELGAAHREERHSHFACNCACEQGFTGSRRTY